MLVTVAVSLEWRRCGGGGVVWLFERERVRVRERIGRDKRDGRETEGKRKREVWECGEKGNVAKREWRVCDVWAPQPKINY